jgi:hypothetical protein
MIGGILPIHDVYRRVWKVQGDETLAPDHPVDSGYNLHREHTIATSLNKVDLICKINIAD